MSASVRLDNLEGEAPRDVEQVPAATGDQLVISDEVEIIEDAVVIESDPIPASDLADPQSSAFEPPVAADDVVSGFQDPIMPFVILGAINLIIILSIAAFLVL